MAWRGGVVEGSSLYGDGDRVRVCDDDVCAFGMVQISYTETNEVISYIANVGIVVWCPKLSAHFDGSQTPPFRVAVETV